MVERFDLADDFVHDEQLSVNGIRPKAKEPDVGRVEPTIEMP